MSQMYAVHELSTMFPELTGPEFDHLVNSIKEDGLLTPITLWRPSPNAEPVIIDGRNRLRAAEVAQVEPRFVEFEGTYEDVLRFVVASNCARRHLNESARAMLAQELTRKGLDRETAAQILRVSERSVVHARRVADHAPDNVVALVRKGDVAVSAAAEISKRLTKDEQAAITTKEQAKQVAKAVIGNNSAAKRVVKLRKALHILKGLSAYVDQVASEPNGVEIQGLRSDATKAADVLSEIRDRLAARRDLAQAS